MIGLLPRLCCLDLDTFFVSVERLIDPSLEGKPVVVGGRRGGGGVVTAASYEVRTFGVRSGMSIMEATNLAPQAVFLPGHHGAYGDYSTKARKIVERYSPVVQAASIDEQYIDFRGCEGLYRRADDEDDDDTIRRVVCEITDTIQHELGLPSSAGIATNRSMAKVASGLAKPRGVLLVKAGQEAQALAPLPVRKLPGIGPVTEKKLLDRGIQTLGQLAGASLSTLRRIFGADAPRIALSARGVGTTTLGRERPAFREHDPRGQRIGSISNECTFKERSGSRTAAILSGLCERVSWRARQRGVKARTVTLKLRYADFHTLSRSRTIAPTSCDLEIHRVVQALFQAARAREVPVRLLGVSLSQLGFEDEQLSLFEEPAARCQAIDSVREKYGYEAVRLATSRLDANFPPAGSRLPGDRMPS